MSAPIYLGDEVSAAGFRLAGARIAVPDEGARSVRRSPTARAQAPLVLVSAAVAARIPEGDMAGRWLGARAAHADRSRPRGAMPVPDVAARLRRQLGMEA